MEPAGSSGDRHEKNSQIRWRFGWTRNSGGDDYRRSHALDGPVRRMTKSLLLSKVMSWSRHHRVEECPGHRDLWRPNDAHLHDVQSVTNLGARIESALSAHNRVLRIADLFRLRHAAARSTTQERLGRVAHRVLVPCRATHVPAADPGWRLLAMALWDVTTVLGYLMK